MLVEGYFGEAEISPSLEKVHSCQHNVNPTDHPLLITDNARQRICQDINVKRKEASINALNRTEKSIQMGLFCITFMYFRAINAFRKGKLSCSGDDDLIGGGDKNDISNERRKIIKEEESARALQQLVFEVEEKVKVGQDRQLCRKRHESINMVRVELKF